MLKIIENKDSSSINSQSLKRLAVKTKNKYCFISINDIKYIYSTAHYAEIHTLKKERFVFRTTMKDLVKKLDSTLFLRVNRSTIINITQVKELISEGQGDFSILMLDEKYFSLSRIYKKEFLQFFGIRLGA